MAVKNEREKAFPKADIPFLISSARNIGLEVNIPRDIREAQKLKNAGINVPGNYDPEEAYLLLQITKKIKNNGPSVVPDGLVVYLNDRGVTNIPENDVPTALFRKTRVAQNNLFSAVSQIADSIKK